MIMLTGIKAFEACWQSLKSSTGANSSDSRVLMQAMGRLVDNYATHDEISQELPVALRDAFNRLVNAYLAGYWLDDTDPNAVSATQPSAVVGSSAMLAAIQLRQRRKMQPTEASEAETYVIRNPAELWVRDAV